MQKLKSFFIISLILFCPVLFFAYGAELVDINTASLEQLDSLTGIGPTLGQRIIDNRPYASVDDLLRVRGIGSKNLEKIKQQGLACVNCQELTTNNIKHPPKAEITNKESSTTLIISTTSKNAVIRADLPAEVSTEAGRPTSLQNTIPNNIFLSEILPSPEGADTENEFIELFNANNFTADISGFKIKDKIGAIRTFVCPMDTKILANGSFVFKSNQTKISLNNTGDGVELLDLSGKTIDSTDFGKSQPGQSWSKNENSWQWTAKPTPGQTNIMVAIQTASASSAQATSSKTNLLTANVQNYPPQKKNFLAVGIATIIALSSALIAWRIKKNSTEV